jgi:hypothetical protein
VSPPGAPRASWPRASYKLQPGLQGHWRARGMGARPVRRARLAPRLRRSNERSGPPGVAPESLCRVASSPRPRSRRTSCRTPGPGQAAGAGGKLEVRRWPLARPPPPAAGSTASEPEKAPSALGVAVPSRTPTKAAGSGYCPSRANFEGSDPTLSRFDF